jgi:hypothetical protein
VVEELLRQALAAWDAEAWLDAAIAYERLLEMAPDDPRGDVWAFDAALAYKFLRNWQEAHRLGKVACLNARRGEEDPAFWNLGIAATVLRDWETARDAWRGYGVAMPEGTGPINEDFGVTCVRLAAEGTQDVVWARRLCPTRARVLSVPFNTTRRYGEVVLHDGAPNGHRVADGQTYSVFDEILLFEPSDVPTLSVAVNAAGAADFDALGALFSDHGLGFEPLNSGVLLCKCCSEGTVDSDRLELSGDHRVLLAGRPERAEELLRQWSAASASGRSWTDLHAVT